MRPLLGVLVGVAGAVCGAYGLFLSPASGYFFPALVAAALLGALTALVGGSRFPRLDLSPDTRAAGRRAWLRAVVAWFPLGIAVGCAATVVGLFGYVVVYLEP